MINTIEKYTLKSPRDVFLREQFYGNSRCFRVAGPDRRWPAGACSGSIPVQTHHGPRPARRGKEGRPERRRALRHCNSSRGPGSASVASRGQRAPSFSFLLFLSLSKSLLAAVSPLLLPPPPPAGSRQRDPFVLPPAAVWAPSFPLPRPRSLSALCALRSLPSLSIVELLRLQRRARTPASAFGAASSRRCCAFARPPRSVSGSALRLPTRRRSLAPTGPRTPFEGSRREGERKQ